VVIKVGTGEFFVTNVSSTRAAGGISEPTQDITLTPFFRGFPWMSPHRTIPTLFT
jgi:MSHA biogenesis protein MshL